MEQNKDEINFHRVYAFITNSSGSRMIIHATADYKRSKHNEKWWKMPTEIF